MALVEYDDSDCESDDDNQITFVFKKSSDNLGADAKKNVNKTFLTLPQPKSKVNEQIIMNDNTLEEEKPTVKMKRPLVDSSQEKKESPLFPTLPKPKTGGKIKIIIPSLNDVFVFIV